MARVIASDLADFVTVLEDLTPEIVLLFEYVGIVFKFCDDAVSFVRERLFALNLMTKSAH